VHPRTYTRLAQELRERLESPDGGGAAARLVFEVQEAAASILAQLDRHPELKLGVRFLLHGTANALASERMVHGCLGRKATPREEQAVAECAVAIARAATQIDLP
jgi:hypothetical protein